MIAAPPITARDAGELIALGAIWGASFLFMRVAVPEFGPIPLIAARVGVAALFLGALLAHQRRLGALVRHAAPLTLLGAINSAVPFTLFAYAVTSLSAGFAAVLNSTAPLFGAVVAFLWMRDRPRTIRTAGLLIGFAGVFILVWERLSFPSDRRAIAAGLAAAVLYGISATFTRTRLKEVDPLVIATGSLISAAAILAAPALANPPAAMPSRAAWTYAVMLGVLCTGVAYILYFRLLRRIGPTRTLAVTYLIPLFGMWWGYLFLGETLSRAAMAGCIVILVGTALATRG